MERVLFVCTANICRSPMAERLLAFRLGDRTPKVAVSSAGVRTLPGSPASPGAAAALANRGIELAGHSSRGLDAELLQVSDLVLTMERAHTREAAVMEPDVWPRTYTLREIVRRGTETGARFDGETLTDWTARLHQNRGSEDALGASVDDDIADPHGGPEGGYERTARELELLVARLEHLAWGFA